MAKSLKDILQGVKSSKKVVNDLGGYKPKAGDEEDFAKKHEIEKHEDRVGNGDDVYNATNVKHSMEKETRHGHKKPKDESVYEEKKTCNMTEAGQMCEVHGMADCAKGGKKVKVLKEKEPVSEEWYSEKGGERTFHKGQREAMRHAREIGGKYGATHGAQGMKASKALGWDAREKEGLGLGLSSKADKAKAAQKQKAAKKAGPWGLRESVPAVIKNTLPAIKKNLPATTGSKSVAKPGLSDKVKKTIGTGAVLGTGAAGYMSLPDKDDEDTKKNAPSSAKKDDFPQAGRWRDDDDKKTTTPEREVIPTQHVPVDMPKKEPDEPVFNPKTPESYWDKQSRMKGEIEDAKHKARLKKIEAGEKDDDDEDEFKPKVINGVTVRSIFKNKAEKDEHERATKASMDPEGTTQKFLRSLKDKQTADPVTGNVAVGAPGKFSSSASTDKPSKNDFNRQAEMIPSDERRKPKNIGEALSKKADAGEWISDFVHSDNPKFAGKSKEKRKQMALAAYYAKQRNEEVEIEEEKQYIEVTNRHTGAKKHIEVHPSKAYAALNQYKKSGDKARIVSKSVKEEAVSEAVKTGNEGHGYHGEAYGAATSDDKMAEAGKAYAKAHALVKQHAAEHLKDVKNPNKMVKHYLDSQYGRHLHGNEHDASYVKKDFAHFKKKYKPEMHEEADLEEALKGKQHKIDKNKNGKIDAEDFRLLRKEDLAVPLLGSMSGEKIGKTNLKKKVKKEQTGPDTPLTLPNMSVDVNTGRNV